MSPLVGVKTERFEESRFKDQFEYAISLPYPADHHLMQHGDMASVALSELWEAMSQDNIEVVIIEDSPKFKRVAFRTFEKKEDLVVSIPALEAFAWLMCFEDVSTQRIIPFFNGNSRNYEKWAYAISAYFVRYGDLPSSAVQVGKIESFPYSRYMELLLKLEGKNFTERIKKDFMESIFELWDKFGIKRLPEIKVTVNGYPTAILQLEDDCTQLVPFRTAFIEEEEMPNLRREIQLGLR